MLKRNEFYLSLLQPTVDTIIILFSWSLAYLVRFEYMSGGQIGLEMTFMKLSVILAVISLYILNHFKLYHSQRFNSRWTEMGTVLKSNTLSFVIFVILLYFFSKEKISRMALFNYFIISSILLTTFRFMLRNTLRYFRRKGKNLRRVLLLGNGPQLEEYIKNVKKYKDSGISIIGRIDLKENFFSNKAVEELKPDTIVIGYSGDQSYQVNQILDEIYDNLTPIQLLPDLSYAFIGHEINHFGGLPIISLNQPKIGMSEYIIKRLFDFFVSLVGFVFISPLLLLIAFVVKFSSKGPVLYGQERVGLDGKPFTMWKFRSMKVDAEKKVGAVWCVRDDPRRTSFGRFLRITSLDELPQLWNVLKGEMSLVGPRPERPIFVEQFKDQIPNYMLRHKVKAGITGLAQVNGWRGNTDLKKRIECDISYIKDWSLWLDIKIIILTFWKGLINKNAY